MTWQNSDLDQKIKDYATWPVNSDWFPTVGADYCVASASYTQHYVIPRPPPAKLSDSDLAPLITELLAQDGGLIAPQPDAIFVFFPPAGTQVDPSGARHLWSTFRDRPLALAVIDHVTWITDRDFDVVVSHELIEAATDPFPEGAFGVVSDFNWGEAFGVEVGDLCDFVSVTDDAGHTVTRTWSDSAAARGQGSPCYPVPASGDYLNLSPENPGVFDAPPGRPTTIQLTGWSPLVGSTSSWSVQAVDDTNLGAKATLSPASIVPGQTIQLSVTPPATADAGDYALILVSATDPTGTEVGAWPIRFNIPQLPPCHGVSGSCSFDYQCCLGPATNPTFCDAGVCATCAIDNQPCQLDSDCCTGDCDNHFCEDLPAKSLGEPCYDKTDCLGSLNCVANSCCVGTGGACQSAADCCALSLPSAAACTAHACTICIADNQVCNQDADCCSGDCDNEVCNSLPPATQGQVCIDSQDCATGLTCNADHLCVAPCVNLGGSCTDDGACCTSTTSGILDVCDSANVCLACTLNGSVCTNSSQCCGRVGCYFSPGNGDMECSGAGTGKPCIHNYDCTSNVCTKGICG